ncbi:tetratricopeptide repeat protein [Sorangium sp. So ce385]|uniref:tetratricopeptide repeat protein n=1 Tax=Sorangium sp. So ce385 TaxID=3133308 RepID=UPI003F5C8F88
MGGEAATAELGTFEQILGPDRGAAYRRFVEWSVGAGFALAVVEIRHPAHREALAAATRAAVPSLCLARLDSLGARPVRTQIEEVCPAPAEASVLMLTHLEESRDAARISAELNVHRDEFARRFALPWVLVVHPAAALALQRDAPDFCDFAGLWLPNEPNEGAEPLLEQALRSPTATSGSTVRLSLGATNTPNDMLSLAHEAAIFGHVDRSADLLAQYDMKHPDARDHDARRVHLDGLLFRIRGRFDEALARFYAALELCKEAEDRYMRGGLLNEIAHIRRVQGDFADAQRLEREAMDLLKEPEDQKNRAASLRQLSFFQERSGNNSEALRLAAESLKLSEDLGDQLGIFSSLYQLSLLEGRMGNHARARDLARESLAISDKLGDRNGRFQSLQQLAIIAYRESNYSVARELLHEALRIADEIGNPIYRLMTLQGLATVALLEGNRKKSQELWSESLELSEALGAKENHATSLVSLGLLEADQGRIERGLALVRQGVEILERLEAAHLPEVKEILRVLESLSAANAR